MRLLLTVAHPDDESFGCGSLLAHATARGVESVVLCATRGDAGECPPDVSPETLGAVREQELRDAADILGVGRVEVLDYGDSGLTGPIEPGTLVAAPIDEVADDITRVIDDVRPDVVVTLAGSDGHRDHQAIRDATLVAIERSRYRPARTYVMCLARSSMRRWVEHMRTLDKNADYTAMRDIGTPDADITTIVDVRPHLATRWAAIRAHGSQVSPYEGIPAALQDEFLATDRLQRVDPPWAGGQVETDVFA